MESLCPKCGHTQVVDPAIVRAMNGRTRCRKCLTIYETALAPGNTDELNNGAAAAGKRRKSASRWLGGLLVLMLFLGLLAQIAWWWRVPLLQLPQAQPLCAYIDCSIAEQKAPQAFEVIERSLTPDAIRPQALRLWLRLRNGASFAQAWPALQLTLSDRNGSLLARRTLWPVDYLSAQQLTLGKTSSGEVSTIEIFLKDPGERASGFEIAFF